MEQIDPSEIKRTAEERKDTIKDLENLMRATRRVIDEQEKSLKLLVSLAFHDLGIPQRTVAQWAGISPTKVRRWNQAVLDEMAQRAASAEDTTAEN